MTKRPSHNTLEKCKACEGTGRMESCVEGSPSVKRTCNACEGSGKTHESWYYSNEQWLEKIQEEIDALKGEENDRN